MVNYRMKNGVYWPEGPWDAFNAEGELCECVDCMIYRMNNPEDKHKWSDDDGVKKIE